MPICPRHSLAFEVLDGESEAGEQREAAEHVLVRAEGVPRRPHVASYRPYERVRQRAQTYMHDSTLVWRW